MENNKITYVKFITYHFLSLALDYLQIKYQQNEESINMTQTKIRAAF